MLRTVCSHSELAGGEDVKDYSPFSPPRSDASTPSSLYEQCEFRIFFVFVFVTKKKVGYFIGCTISIEASCTGRVYRSDDTIVPN